MSVLRFSIITIALSVALCSIPGCEAPEDVRAEKVAQADQLDAAKLRADQSAADARKTLELLKALVGDLQDQVHSLQLDAVAQAQAQAALLPILTQVNSSAAAVTDLESASREAGTKAAEIRANIAKADQLMAQPDRSGEAGAVGGAIASAVGGPAAGGVAGMVVGWIASAFRSRKIVNVLSGKVAGGFDVVRSIDSAFSKLAGSGAEAMKFVDQLKAILAEKQSGRAATFVDTAQGKLRLPRVVDDLITDATTRAAA